MSKWREAFEEFMDSIYFTGFTQQLEMEDNERYQWELSTFLEWYE